MLMLIMIIIINLTIFIMVILIVTRLVRDRKKKMVDNSNNNENNTSIASNFVKNCETHLSMRLLKKNVVTLALFLIYRITIRRHLELYF